MPSIQLIVTDAGRAALVNAQHNGTNAVTIAQMGVSGTPIVATPATAALPGEVKRIATISGGAVAADTMHVVVRDESADVFTVRSFALYLSDGTLFASYGQAGVIAEKSAQAMLLFAVDVIFADINAAMLTFGDANFLNPPATTDTAGVVKLATDAEANAMVNAIKALTPRGLQMAFTAANVLARLLTVDGAGSGLDADLLDGQQGNYYTDIVGRLGYTPLNRAGDAMTGILGIQASTGADGPLRIRNVTGTSSIDIIGDGGGVYGQIGLASPNGSTNMRLVANNLFEIYAQNAIRASIGAGGAAFYVNLTRSGATVWDAANDGAGSGLDADLLDGQDGSYYTNIVARLGYTPANRAGDTLGAMSATRFIGINGDSESLRSTGVAPFITFYNAAQTTRFGYIQHTGSDFAIANDQNGTVSLWVANSARLTVSSSGIGFAGTLTRSGSTIWDAGNDGAGSGLDADLLDGRQAVEFALLTGATFTGALNLESSSPALALQSSTYGNQYKTSLTVAATAEGFLQLGNNGTNTILAGNSVAGGALRIVVNQTANAPVVNGTTAMTFASTGAVSIPISLTVAGNTAWHAGNDGAGSGLDADLLDGQQGTYYTDIVGRLGYTPLNRTGDTFLGLLNLYAATGGDAPLRIRNTSGTSSIDVIGDNGTVFGIIGLSTAVGAANLRLTATNGFEFYAQGGLRGTLTASAAAFYVPITRSGATVWDAANDGSGSGLDADLLDGLHASAFALLTDATRYGSNGNGYWEKRPNGVIEQWGQISGPFIEQQLLVTFPIAFTDAASVQIVAMGHNYAASDKKDMFIQLVSLSVNGCTLFAQWSAAASSLAQLDGVTWRAIGR